MCPIKTSVAGHELVGYQLGMGRDQEVGHDPGAGATGGTITLPCLASMISRAPRDRGDLDGERFEGLIELGLSGETGCELSVNRLTNDKAAFFICTHQCLPRRRSKHRVGKENVEQHIGIDGGDHNPRNAFMISSERRSFAPRIP